MKIENALYLLPVNISDAPLRECLPAINLEFADAIRYFIVENIRTARRFLKRCNPAVNISDLVFYELNGHTPEDDISSFLEPLRCGEPMALMSEAGCPAVADPGAVIVRVAQSEGLRVVPLVGPSSLLMSLMASGLNGQRFAFQGYLPVDNADREKKIRDLESQSGRDDMTQIFIETPYRNVRMMESLLKILRGDTLLCVATGVTDPVYEKIVTKSVAQWRRENYNIEKVPTVFLFYNAGKSRLR